MEGRQGALQGRLNCSASSLRPESDDIIRMKIGGLYLKNLEKWVFSIFFSNACPGYERL